jgi:hypothetical protein
MATIVYDYPKSSCECLDGRAVEPRTSGVPTNMSVLDCDFAPYELSNNSSFLCEITPQYKTGYHYINPGVLANDTQAADFEKVSCPLSQGCKTVYASPDPRLIDVLRNSTMTLDRPPLDSSIKLKDINTTESLRGYGQNYRTYSDINAGQIYYYIDKSIEDPFFSPNFTIPAQTNGLLYRDPMGGMDPEYNREPLTKRDCLNTKNSNYIGGLSWMEDTTEHREDILSKQMSRQNREKYSARWPAP